MLCRSFDRGGDYEAVFGREGTKFPERVRSEGGCRVCRWQGVNFRRTSAYYLSFNYAFRFCNISIQSHDERGSAHYVRHIEVGLLLFPLVLIFRHHHLPDALCSAGCMDVLK